VNFLLFCASGTLFRQEFFSFMSSNCGFRINWRNDQNLEGSIVGITKCEEEILNPHIRYVNQSDISSARSERYSSKQNGKTSLESQPV
jgi:hypothetical protein